MFRTSLLKSCDHEKPTFVGAVLSLKTTFDCLNNTIIEIFIFKITKIVPLAIYLGMFQCYANNFKQLPFSKKRDDW